MNKCFKIALLTIICLLGLTKSGNLIPDAQNPIQVNTPDLGASPTIDARFQLDTASAGLAYNQYIVMVFPPNVATNLQFDQGTTLKYSCALTDGTTTYTMTADRPVSATEGNFAYCRLTDLVNNSIKAGTKLKLSVLLIGVKFTTNFVRSMKIFTATSNKLAKIIIDQASFAGNVALYADPLTFTNKAIDITSSAILLGSSTVTNIYPYQTFDISLNIKSNIFISANDFVFTFKFNKDVVTAAQSAISNSLNLGSSTDPLNAAVKGSLTVSTATSGDLIVLSGITEDLIPNRQFQIVLKSWRALDKKTNELSPLEMRVYYKNTYSLISYVNASTNFFRISLATVALTAGHPDGWDIFRNGVFPMRFTFTSQQDLTNGGFVLIQQTNTQDLISRFNFVASTCDFSENDNNFDQAFGKRPQCYPIRTDFNYNTSSSSGYAGSGIFFYVKSLQANKTYYITVWGSADACGGSASVSNFASAIAVANTNTQFNFQLTVYNGIKQNEKNETRFTSVPILGQSISQTMSNKCWNTMTSLMTALSGTATANAPDSIPFVHSLMKAAITVTATTDTNACDPTNAVAASAYCKLTADINLYREFTNIKLINHTTAFTSGLYMAKLGSNTTGNTENFLYGSNIVSSNSYFAVTFEFPIYGKTSIIEFLPSPVAYDVSTAEGVKSVYRHLPGRLELKVQKQWFSAGDAASNTTPGCYFSWGINQSMFASDGTTAVTTLNADRIMKNVPVPATGVTYDCAGKNGGGNFISSFTTGNVNPCNAVESVAMLDRDNSLLPVANTANTYAHYKILSLWNATGTGEHAGLIEAAVGAGPKTAAAATRLRGSGYTGNSHFGFPVPNLGLPFVDTTDLSPNLGHGTGPTLVYGLFSSCLKWSPPTTIKSLYTSLDIQLNYLYATDSATITSAVPNRAIRLIKLFPEGGVFQDIAGTATRLITTPSDSTSATTRSYKLHFATGLNNINVGVCLIEIYGTGLGNTSDGSSPVLGIWIGFGVILEQDYNDLSSNYPVAPLASSSYNTYGLQSGYFMNIKENWNVHTNFEETNVFSQALLAGAALATSTGINKLPIRNLLQRFTNSGLDNVPAYTAAYNGETAHSDLATYTSPNRSSYLFLMGSLVLVTGITSNSITTSSNVSNLMIPIYCPINDTGSAPTVKHYGGLPTVYMAFMTMSAFNSITSVNRIYSHKTGTNLFYTVISPVAGSANYYRAFANFANADLFASSTDYNKYLFTLRWATYTSTITNNDNILYVYYNNASGAAPLATNPNCTGHTFLVNSTIVTVDSTNLTKSGFANATDPFLFNGTKKFYYLGFEFNKAIMMGLGNVSPNAADTAIGAFSQQLLTKDVSTLYLTGIRRPAVDVFYQSGTYKSPFNNIAYFCASANKLADSKQMYSNFVVYPTSLTRSFIIDFNPPVDTPKTFTVTINQDKSETIFKNDIAGNTRLNITLPARIPGGLSIRFFANSNAFNSNTICGLITATTQPVVECSLISSVLSCPNNRSDNVFTICCYNVSIASDTFSLSSLYVSVPAAPNSDQSTRFNTEKLYDASTQIASTPISWTTGQSSGTDVIGTQSAKISKVEYSQVVQELGIGKVAFTITLPREPTRNMALTMVGDFSGMLIQNNSPRCVVSFGNSLGSNWDASGDVLLDTCDVTNFSGSTAPVVITTKNVVYKCGLSFASKSVLVQLWPVIQVNWSANPYSSNNYKVTMTLNNSSNDAIALNSANFNISSNITYSARPGFISQWDTLCTVSSVVPKIPGEYADYQFDFDLDTNKGALTNSTPNEVSIFFPYTHYGASIPNVFCFYNNATMNCTFTDEGILNIRFTTTLPVGSGKKISIVITGIYNPSFESEIYFPCTINNTNFSTGLRVNLITGSGKLTGGFPIASTVTQGALRYINNMTVTDNNPRNVSTHTFRITFDSAIGLSTSPITISSTPQIIVTFPQDYSLNWYNTVKATATIDEYTNDTTNNIVKGTSINPASVTQSGNRVTIILPAASYTFNTNWRYWEVKVSQITGPTDTTSGSNNNTTGPYSIILTNSNYSSIYRTHSNLNNAAFNAMSTQVDNWIQFNRGVEFKFDNTKWVIDINTSGVFNKLTVRPGRFILSSFTVKTNTANFIQPRAATISLNDQIFRLADTTYSIATALFQPTTFYIGAPCGTAPGNYIVYFNLAGDQVSTFFAPLAPVQIILDSTTTGIVNFTSPPSIPAAASTVIYYSLSEPNVDALSISWVSSETTKNDSTASITSTVIPMASIKAGNSYTANNSMFSTFSITNAQATNNQIFKPNNLNACFTWGVNTLTITISGTQAIIPNLYDFTSSFRYVNSDMDSTLVTKNAVKFVFTPPYSPIYVYCAFACYNRNYPSDDVIRSTTNNNNSDSLTRYYFAMFNSKTATDIVFDNLVRNQRYKLRCIISSTEGTTTQRTSAAVNIEQLSSANGTVAQFIPSATTKTQCIQYYFTSDPGQATKIAMIYYCQRLFSQAGWSQSGCIICTDSALTYTAPGLSLPSNITCVAAASKAKLRFLQTTTGSVAAPITSNSTVLTPTTAGSTVNPSLVNQSNPITFSVCPVQHPVCASDVSGNKLYSDYFNQLIADTRTTALFNTNLGIVNVPVNSTMIVNDNFAPDVSRNFAVSILSLNANGLVQFSASFTSALRCSWQVTETSSAPATGAAVDACTDSQWCGKNFNVGTLVANTSTDINNLKAFGAGKSYGLYIACYNDVPYSTSISNVFATSLSIPNNATPVTPVTPVTPTNTTPISAEYSFFSYAILLILALLI